jgi:hypothetical protein
MAQALCLGSVSRLTLWWRHEQTLRQKRIIVTAAKSRKLGKHARARMRQASPRAGRRAVALDRLKANLSGVEGWQVAGEGPRDQLIKTTIRT